MANVIINTTAVRNNGDVALIDALAGALERRGHSVSIATPHADHFRRVQGRENVCREVLGYSWPIFQRRYLADIAAAICLLLSRTYRKADVILGAPGGYINSYYGFSWRRAIYRWAGRLGKKTGIYAQSVGPLNECDARGIRCFGGEVDVLMTRDGLSHETALRAGFPQERLLSSVDAIFLRRPVASPASAGSRVAVVSVREWKYDGRDVGKFMAMVVHLAERLLARGLEVEFLSTCQGVPGYVDDAAVAREIANRIRQRLGPGVAVHVNEDIHSLEDLISRISTCRLIVGTRLHMCLLALLHGVPAFNISYESKGRECYAYLGFEEFTIDYNEDMAVAERQFDRFLAEEGRCRDRLPAVLDAQHARATRDFEAFLSRLNLQ